MVTLWTGSASSRSHWMTVSGLVVGGGFAFLFFNPPTSTGGRTGSCRGLLRGLATRREFLARQGGDDRGFVDQRGQLSLRTLGCRGRPAPCRRRGTCELCQSGPQDLTAAFDVGQHDLHGAVKATGAGQGRVEHVGSVGGRNHDDLVLHLEAIHFDEDGVQCLLAFVVPAA